MERAGDQRAAAFTGWIQLIQPRCERQREARGSTRSGGADSLEPVNAGGACFTGSGEPSPLHPSMDSILL